MKTIVSYLALVLVISSCNGQSGAKKEAVKTRDAIAAAMPGTTPTAAGKYTMTAKINGKEWKASAMYPPMDAGRIIGYLGEEFIGMPRFDKKSLRVGVKEIFGKENSVQLAMGDKPVYYSGYSGEIEITKVDGDWVEAKFSINATEDNGSKTFKVTDGFVRVNYADK